MATEIVFTGDISFSKYFENGWQKEGLFDQRIEAFLQQADAVVANVESPVTDAKDFKSTRMLNHASNPGAAAFLARNGIRIWSLANNHMMDCGKTGLEDTRRYAQENRCTALGAGISPDEIYSGTVLGEDVRVGLIAVAKPWPYVKVGEEGCGVFTWDQTDAIRKQIAALRSECDYITLIVHGGDEFSDISMPYMREQYHKLLALGADVIVAHHPHVVQEYERIGEKYIFYSLGNFIFDTDHQRKFSRTENGILLRIRFEKTQFSFTHLPVRIQRETGTVCAAKETPAVFREINDDLYQNVWPYAAKAFYCVDLKKRKMTINSMKQAPAWKIFLHEVYTCRKKQMRVIQKGRLKALCKMNSGKVPKALLAYFDESAAGPGGTAK